MTYPDPKYKKGDIVRWKSNLYYMPIEVLDVGEIICHTEYSNWAKQYIYRVIPRCYGTGSLPYPYVCIYERDIIGIEG